MKTIPELDVIMITHDNWPARILAAEACAYRDSDYGRINYVQIKIEYIQYILNKMILDFDEIQLQLDLIKQQIFALELKIDFMRKRISKD